MKRSFLLFLSILAVFVMIPTGSIASSILIGDSSGNIATVDTTTGAASGLFNPSGVDALTDIAYDPYGNLWGITFYDLYSIDVASNSANLKGSFFTSGSDYLNALTFGSDGTAYAMGGSNTNLYTLDLNTGAATSKGSVGFASDGDLAFDNMGNLYLSAIPASAGGHSRLAQINASTPSGTFIGDLGKSNVFGLAFADNKMFGAAGDEIFEINLSTAAISNVQTVSGGLAAALGASQPNPIPEPATMLLLGTGLAGLAGFRRKFRLS